MKDQTLWKFAMGIYLAGFVLLIAGVCGWVMNIIALADSGLALTGMTILRAIGVVILPLGAVLGFV